MSNLKWINGNTDCRPEDVDYNSASLERLDEFFMELIDEGKMQGASYLLARHGKIFAYKSTGLLKTSDKKTALKPDSIRWVASITKSFTATAIMKLVEDGKLYLYKGVSEILDEFNTPQHRKITIEHLLSHTSGSVMPDSGSMDEAYPRPFIPFSEKDWEDTEECKSKVITHFLSGPKLNDPGKEWMYSTAGFIILAEIICRVSGISYFRFIKEYILDPLGMDHTFFNVPKKLHDKTCIVEGQYHSDLNFELPERFEFMDGGGGLYSTLHDLWKFGSMLLNKGEFNGTRILGPHTVEEMTRNRLRSIPSVCWGANIKDTTHGLGFGYNNPGLISDGTFGHEGAGRSRLLIDPEEDLIFVYFVPSATDWLPESISMPPQIVWSGLK
jgi:CubicO group peptidase (beta-lactamase class C family)